VHSKNNVSRKARTDIQFGTRRVGDKSTNKSLHFSFKKDETI